MRGDRRGGGSGRRGGTWCGVAGLVALPRTERFRCVFRDRGSDGVWSRPQSAVAAARAAGTFVADPARRSDLPHRLSRRRTGDAGHRPDNRAGGLGSAGAAGEGPIVDKRNNPRHRVRPSSRTASTSFPDYGLIAYDGTGRQRWSMPLGPFTNIYGMGASPVIVGDLVVLVCDQSVGSFIMAVDKRSGRVKWRTERPEAKSGHSTPIVWRGADGRDQIVVPGSFLLTSADAATGRKLWWVRGLSFEMKSTPVIGGDTIYVNGYGAPVNDPGNKVDVPPAEEVGSRLTRMETRSCRRPSFRNTPGLLVRRRGSRCQRLVDACGMGLLPGGARFRERDARDPARRQRRHDRDRRPLEVPAQRPATALAAALRRRPLHGERQRHHHHAQPRTRAR